MRSSRENKTIWGFPSSIVDLAGRKIDKILLKTLENSFIRPNHPLPHAKKKIASKFARSLVFERELPV